MAKHYYYDGGRLIAEKWSTGAYLLYHYDENGSIYAITYSSTGSGYAKYYLLRNLQGDVVQILDSENNVIGNYSYDAWGNLLSVYYENGNEITDASNFALINPIRYRGYYYDSETGFYYLKSRYYDPANCRFISADSQMDLENGTVNLNLFAYCGNDPVNKTDPTGKFGEEIWNNFVSRVKKAVKWVSKNIVKPVVKPAMNFAQDKLSNIDGTLSTGVNFSGCLSIYSINLQGGLSIDAKGNVGLQGTFSGGFSTGTPGGSLTLYQSVSNAPSIFHLEGPGYQTGGSIGIPVGAVPLALGGDFNILEDTNANQNYYGFTGNVGIGTPGAEFHVEWGETVTWRSSTFNIFDAVRDCYRVIMEW